MADIVFTDCSVKLATVDLSDHTETVTFEQTAVALDNTAMGGGGVVSRLGGLKDGTITLNMYQDFAASKTYATLQPALGTVIAWELIPVKGTAVSATNPRISGNALLTKVPILTGKVGTLMMSQITLLLSGAVTYASS
jgi:hypothetical protein